MHLNIIKAQQNGFVTDLKQGDKVRIDDTSLFKKGTESRWSDEVHVVQSASGKSVTLTDGTTHRHSKVLMVQHNAVIVPTAQLEKNIIKVATKKHKDKLLYKRENIRETDIIRSGRASRNRTAQDYNTMANKQRVDGKLENGKKPAYDSASGQAAGLCKPKIF
jgi:hypothetical protein